MTAQVLRFSDYDKPRSTYAACDTGEPCLVVLLPNVPQERLCYNPVTGMVEVAPMPANRWP